MRATSGPRPLLSRDRPRALALRPEGEAGVWVRSSRETLCVPGGNSFTQKLNIIRPHCSPHNFFAFVFYAEKSQDLG